MKLYQDNLYHIYNRGNNRELIFFKRENYLYFLSKLRKHVFPFVDILSYCLMPNHFHLMVFTSSKFISDNFSKGFKTMLSSYTRAINIQEGRTGSLFQQNSKAKCLTGTKDESTSGYPLICFNYIHQNPIVSFLVSQMEDWEFSSFPDYIGMREQTLCSKNLALDLLDLPKERDEFYKMSYDFVNPEKVKLIF